MPISFDLENLRKTHDCISSMNVTKTFISFGGPTENYHNSLTRISEEAKQSNFFDYIHGFTEKDLKNNITFWEKHGNFI